MKLISIPAIICIAIALSSPAVLAKGVKLTVKTLSDLGCTVDGAIPIFNATLGEWECGQLPAGGGSGLPLQVVADNGNTVGVLTSVNYNRHGELHASVMIDLDSFPVRDPVANGKSVVIQVRTGKVENPGGDPSGFTGQFRPTSVGFAELNCQGQAYVAVEQGFAPAITPSAFVRGPFNQVQIYLASSPELFDGGVVVQSSYDRSIVNFVPGPNQCSTFSWAGFLAHEAVLAVDDVGAVYPEPLSLEFLP